MFQGEAVRKLDSKSRVIIPTQFRHFMGDEQPRGFFLAVVPLGEEKCIRLYLPSEWKRVIQALRRIAPQSSNPDAFTRVVSAHAEFGELDGQHRILIPQRLIGYASLERGKDLVLVGCSNHIQMWNLQEWRRTVDQDRKVIRELSNFVRATFGGYGGPAPS